MSSKSRRNRARAKRRSQHLNQPASSRPGWPNRTSAPASRGRGAKTFIVLAALAVLAGLVVYAINTSRATKSAAAETSAPDAPPPNTKSSPSPLPQPDITATAASVPTTGPRIQFASPVYDFGKANGDDLVQCLFIFTNTGNALLEISEVAPGCGCMKAGEWSRKVEPGQTGSIAVQYDSHHYTGPFAKSVFVTCNDANQPKPMLEIKGYVWRPIEITPPSAVLNLNAEVPSNAAVVRIIGHLDQPLTLSDLQIDNHAFTVELQTNRPGEEYQLLVTPTPPWPTNTQQGNITLKTSTTNMPAVNIYARINLQPAVYPIPYLVRLPAPPLTNPFPYTIWVQNHGTSVLALSEATVNAHGVEARINEDQAGRQFSVALNFPAGFVVSAGEKVELSIKSNHPQFPIIKVPVLQPPLLAPVVPTPTTSPQPVGP